MRKHLLLPLSLLGALLSLSGCQTTTPAAGTSPAPTALQTFEKLYTDAVAADALINSTAATALRSGFISPAQAKEVLAVTDSIKAVLDAAYNASQIGNTGMASANLASALGQIAIASSCLTAKPLTAQNFATCTAKLAAPAVVQS